MKKYDYERVGYGFRIFDLGNSPYTLARCGDVTVAERLVKLLNESEQKKAA